MDKNKKHAGKTWEKKTRIEKQTLDNYDFTGTDLNHPIFANVNFKLCLFEKTLFQDARIYGCSFELCDFVSVDFRNTTLGAQGAIIKNCVFKKCDFSGMNFEYPHFINCVFDHCKLKKINFNDSSFDNCKFNGKIADVTFNGIYHRHKTPHKPIQKADFSEAIFGDFVGFEDCDLSTSVPPKGTSFEKILYVVDVNDPKHKSTGTKDRIVIK
ncbi:MAG: pentapeptide repeat-containing protein [Chitinophagaceae bacterium]